MATEDLGKNMQEAGRSNKAEKHIKLIIEDYEPDRIFIFGSYARGEAGPDSDLDILIIKDTADRPVERCRKVLRLLKGSGIPKDIFVVTRREFDAKKDLVGTVAYEAHHFGEIVYG